MDSSHENNRCIGGQKEKSVQNFRTFTAYVLYCSLWFPQLESLYGKKTVGKVTLTGVRKYTRPKKLVDSPLQFGGGGAYCSFYDYFMKMYVKQTLRCNINENLKKPNKTERKDLEVKHILPTYQSSLKMRLKLELRLFFILWTIAYIKWCLTAYTLQNQLLLKQL